MHRCRPVLLLLLLAALACGPADLRPAGQLAETSSAAPELPAGQLGADLRVIDLAVPPGGRGAVEVELTPGDTSLLFVATAADDSDLVFIDEVLAPDGTSAEPDQVENAGQNAIALPTTDDRPLEPGTYTIFVDVAGVLESIQALVKRSDPFAEQVIDATFYIVSDSDRLDEEAERAALGEVFRAQGERILSPHGLGVGSLEFRDVPQDLIAAHAELRLIDDNDPPLRQLCRQLTSLDVPHRAMVFAIVDDIVGRDGPDGTEGIAAGTPGSAVLAGSTGCAAIVLQGERDIAELDTTTWHEAGHSMGLLHTTEAEGDVFDELADTPACPARLHDDDGDGFVDAQECAGADGDNVMFHDGDGVRLTADQAFVLRHSPLFRPAG